MSVSTNQIPSFLSCVVRITQQPTQYDIRKTLYELGYPFVGELAGLIKKQNPVYICHHLLSVNPKNPPVPSMAFSGGLAGLAEGTTAEGHENQDQQSNNQNHLTYRITNSLHHVSLLSDRAGLYYLGGTKHTLANQLYKLPELLSKKNVPKWVRKYAKKKDFYVVPGNDCVIKL